jgi:hypothetical protein
MARKNGGPAQGRSFIPISLVSSTIPEVKPWKIIRRQQATLEFLFAVTFPLHSSLHSIDLLPSFIFVLLPRPRLLETEPSEGHRQANEQSPKTRYNKFFVKYCYNNRNI